MFRVGLSYFREISSGAVLMIKSAGGNGNNLRVQLLRALEKARCRLAIAIAEETKSTPWGRRKDYLDTSDHLRRLVGKLDSWEADDRIPSEVWKPALEALESIPLKEGARSLSKSLNAIVEFLR
jgi:hypothetical protein